MMLCTTGTSEFFIIEMLSWHDYLVMCLKSSLDLKWHGAHTESSIKLLQMAKESRGLKILTLNLQQTDHGEKRYLELGLFSLSA